MAKGTIKKLVRDRGFGFIRAEDGREIFFHKSAVKNVPFEALAEGQAVEFDVEKGETGSKGRGPRAENVRAEAD